MSISYKLTLLIIGLVAVTALAVGLTIDLGNQRLIRELELDKLGRVLDLHATAFHDTFTDLRADAELLSGSPLLNRAAKAPDAEREAMLADPAYLDRVANLFRVFQGRRRAYLQVRVLRADDRARELVRVDRRGDEVVRIPKAELQEKGVRPYVRQGLAMRDDEVWLSDIELNRERGQITPQREPVIRAVAPVCDEQGVPRLLLVINKRIDAVLDRVQLANTDNQRVYLANASGDLLIHPDPRRTFGFEFGRPHLIQTDWPRLSGLFDDALPAPPDDEPLIHDSEVLRYVSVPLDEQDPDRDVVVAVSASLELVLAASQAIRQRSLMVSVLLIGVAALVAYGLSCWLTRPLREITQAAEQYAANDATVELPAIKSNDELGVLGRHFNNMLLEVRARESALRATAEELRHVANRAEASERAKDEFLANMSHEIRTPLTAILGYSEVLQDPRCEAEEKRQAIESVARNGEHLLGLINDILDVSKLESDRMEVECVPCGPVDLLTQIESMMRARAHAKHLTYETQVLTAVPREVRTDPVRLRQVLVNLVGNAIKFTDEGSVRVTLGYEAGPDGGWVRYVVQDTGPGIPSEVQGRLFQPFAQADASVARRYGGTGLGLTICSRLTSLLGGRIELDSTPGLGSTFSVVLPVGLSASDVELVNATVAEAGLDRLDDVEPQPQPHALPPLPTVPALPPSTEFSGQRVLLADDSPDNRRLYRFLLGKMGLDVTLACDGGEAIYAATQAEATDRPFELILMDVSMPEVDGLAATRELRSRDMKLPIIALTANAMPGDRERCIAAGCSAYVTKPVERETLKRVLAHWLGVELAPSRGGYAA